MKLSFLGADREVTGSCTMVEAAGHRFLVDCGMEQGSDTYENVPLPVAPGEVEAMLLTHAHIDHSGRIPYLYKNGFRGPIYATEATADLCDIMLEDSAHIKEQDAEQKNRKAQRSGRPLVEPDYTVEDALNVLKQFVPKAYNEPFDLFNDGNVTVKMTDVGHLLGSASITLTIKENGETQTIVFSGDIGNLNQPLLRDPQYLDKADFVVMESTYGDRTHGPRPDYIGQLTQLIQTTLDKGGNLVIPSFAVGRTQELLYFIRQIKADGLVHGHDGFPVYVDSPMANRSTNVFKENYDSCMDKDTQALLRQGINPLQFPGLVASVTKEDSVAINNDNQPKVIISASGMCDAGRIRHHLKHNLWREDSTVLFVGYQAGGTLGRALMEGAKEVKLFGEDIEVKAEITSMGGLSGHADKDGLETWIGHFTEKPKFVFVNHGDDEVAAGWAAHLQQEGYTAEAPYNGAVYDVTAGKVTCLAQGNTHKIVKADAQSQVQPDGKRTSPAFERLLNIGKRLLVVIEHNRGGSNKDLARFAGQIDSLCSKWDR